jgi:hypothetical protein
MMDKTLSNTKRKDPEKFNSRDLLNYWYASYAKNSLRGDSYSHRSFIGKELSLFKQAQERHDNFAILYAIDQCLRDHDISIEYFLQKIDQYVPSTRYPKLYFLVSKFGDVEMKTKLLELSVLESSWYPSAHVVQQIDSVVEEINTWIDSHKQFVL